MCARGFILGCFAPALLTHDSQVSHSPNLPNSLRRTDNRLQHTRSHWQGAKHASATGFIAVNEQPAASAASRPRPGPGQAGIDQFAIRPSNYVSQTDLVDAACKMAARLSMPIAWLSNPAFKKFIATVYRTNMKSPALVRCVCICVNMFFYVV